MTLRLPLACLSLLALAGCNGGGAAVDAMPPPPDMMIPVVIGMDQTVTILDHVTHLGGQLQNDGAATLPTGAFSKITLHIDLGCPPAGCDPYDRIASIQVVEAAGGDGGAERTVEIGRFITPFGVRGKWDIDVTDLQPLLTGGAVKFRSYLETYAQNGQGWVVTASLVYVGGLPSPLPVSVQPFPWSRLPVGDPANQDPNKLLPPQMVTLPGGATQAKLRLFVTGHGQGNSDNCAEFCDLQHTVLVDGMPADSRSIWRNDCDQNPLKHQLGTWDAQREGWCPGEAVTPWVLDLGQKKAPFTVAYAAPSDTDTQMPYTNTCAPMMCEKKTCAFGSPDGSDPCQFNGSWHTGPSFVISAIAIGYR